MVRYFCWYTAVGIGMDFLLQITLFPSALLLLDRFQKPKKVTNMNSNELGRKGRNGWR